MFILKDFTWLTFMCWYYFIHMLLETVPGAEWHFPLLLWVSAASTGPWCQFCCHLAEPPSSTSLCAHGWYQLPRFLERQQHYTKAVGLRLKKKKHFMVFAEWERYFAVTFPGTVWNTVDHLSSLKPESLIKRQNIVVISLQIPQPKKTLKDQTLKLKMGMCRMCVQTVCVHWPDNLFPCCCDEEAVLCPHNVYILPCFAAQFNLSFNKKIIIVY